MQKQAYIVRFHPVLLPTGDTLYFDTTPTPLPYAESISTLHYHDQYEIGLCEDGEGLFLSEGVFSSVSQGDVIFIAPDQRHYSRSLLEHAPCRCRFVHPNARRLRDLLLHLVVSEEQADAILSTCAEHIPAILHPSDHPAATALLGDLVNSCRVGTPHLSEMVELRLALFLLQTYHTLTPRPTATDTIPRTDEAVTTVAAYLSVHYDSADTAADLANLCHLSESQLRRRFLTVYGVPPIAYRNRLRCAVAKELLLHTALPIAQISSRVGFGDVSDLYRAFVKHFGTPPSTYRTQKNA